MIAQTEIKYNKRLKTWQTINGRTFDHGDGPTGKRLATWEALAHDAPDVHAITWELCALDDFRYDFVMRALRGAQLLLDGAVSDDGETVASATSDATYHVRRVGTPAEYRCNCPDFGVTMSEGLGPVCKHSLAVHVEYLRPTPFDGAPVDWASIWDGADTKNSEVNF